MPADGPNAFALLEGDDAGFFDDEAGRFGDACDQQRGQGAEMWFMSDNGYGSSLGFESLDHDRGIVIPFDPLDLD